MPNFTELLKTEISRLARKEIRAEIEPLKKIISQQKSELRGLKRSVDLLEKGLRNPKITLNSSQYSSAPFQPAIPPTLTFRNDVFAALRKKLDLTGAEMAKLLGVSIQSVYHWESGKSKPRAAQLLSIAAVRKLGKKEIASRIHK